MPYNPRQLPSTDYHALKAAMRKLIKLGGGYRPSADVTRVGQSTLRDYQDLDRADVFAAIDVVADLEAEIETPVVTAQLAEMLGYILIPTDFRGNDTEWHQIMARMGREIGDVFERINGALEDNNRVDKPEVSGVEKEIDDLMGVLAHAKGRLRQISGEGMGHVKSPL
tara:strand:- start:347 stop:850 length:504 start_codon:yes stop_codon:yes gene_type:complete